MKRILKLLLCGILTYPLLYLYILIDGNNGEKTWFITLVITIVVTSVLILLTLFEGKEQNKKK